MKVIPLVIFPVCLAFLAPWLASGDMVSNFTNEKNQTCKPFVVSDTTLVAGSFTTGRFGGGYKLDEIFLSIVSVTLNPAANNPGGRFRVQLWNNVEGGPGWIIQELFGPKTPAEGLKASSNISYSSGFNMGGNTTYWISATVTGGDDLSVGLEMTNLKTETSNPSGWSIGDKSLLLVGGTPMLDDTCVPFLSVIDRFPEPSSIAILGMGVAGFGVLLRRRKSA